MNVSLFLLTLSLVRSLHAQPPAFDIVVEHDQIVDGTGAPWYSGNVGSGTGRSW